MKPNLRCTKCGNTTKFFWAKKDAQWDEKEEKWKPVFTPKSFAICGVCNSTRIERVKGG